MPPIYLGHSRRHSLGQRCSVCEHLSPTHNLSKALIAVLPVAAYKHCVTIQQFLCDKIETILNLFSLLFPGI